MPPKGYTAITVPETLAIDLKLLAMSMRKPFEKTMSPADVIQKLIEHYRGKS